MRALFFISCILIAFFCFAFYLIWNQFLKKDTRLSTGLQVLRKKMSELQNLSLTVETQMDRQNFAMNEKINRMEYLLQKSKQACEQLAKQVELSLDLKNKGSLETNSFESESSFRSKSPVGANQEGPGKHRPVVPTRCHNSDTSSVFQARFDKSKGGGDFRVSEKQSKPAIKAVHLKMVKNKVAEEKQYYFGKSPFVKLGFVEVPEGGDKPQKPSNHPLPPPS